jgi:hypothetical protein
VATASSDARAEAGLLEKIPGRRGSSAQAKEERALTPEEWRPVERMQELVWRLVDEGFVDEADEEKCLTVVVSQMERWALVPPGSTNRVKSTSKVPRARQLQIVKDYIKFARHEARPGVRHAKIVALGVTPRDMTAWARKFFGRGTLAAARPRSSISVILEELERKPWQTRAGIFAATGILRSTLSGALDWGERTGRIRKRKRKKDGLFEYAKA